MIYACADQFFAGILAGVGAVAGGMGLALIPTEREDGWFFSPVRRAIRKQASDRRVRITRYMQAGLTRQDAAGMVHREQTEESAALRKELERD